MGVTAFSPARAGLDPAFEVVGYLPSRQIPHLDPAQTQHLTDLVYFSLSVKEDGSLPIRRPDPENANFLQMVKSRYGVRLIQGISDHRGSSHEAGGLAALVNHPLARANLVKNLTTYLTDNGFDGADIDWEYPRTWREKANFTLLLQDLHAAFAPRGLRLSLAVSPSRLLERGSYLAVDRVHAMTYDEAGRHSSYAATTWRIRSLIGAGVPKEKLMLGIPFYGRGYYEETAWSKALTWKTIQAEFHPKADQDTAGGFAFNGPDTIRKKIQFAHRLGLGGVMVWEIGQDTADDTSLLKAISAAQQAFAPHLVMKF